MTYANDRTSKGVPSAAFGPGSWWKDAKKSRNTSAITYVLTTTSIALRRLRKRGNRGAHGVVQRMEQLQRVVRCPRRSEFLAAEIERGIGN
eukprot:484690-Pleurochrysis_carterae.AAC.1